MNSNMNWFELSNVITCLYINWLNDLFFHSLIYSFILSLSVCTWCNCRICLLQLLFDVLQFAQIARCVPISQIAWCAPITQIAWYAPITQIAWCAPITQIARCAPIASSNNSNSLICSNNSNSLMYFNNSNS